MRRQLDPGARLLDGGRVLLGGDPVRLVRLPRAAALQQVLDGGAPALAAQLLDRGLVHPAPPTGPAPGPRAPRRPGAAAKGGTTDRTGDHTDDRTHDGTHDATATSRAAAVAAVTADVVVPVRDRAVELDRCLAALGVGAAALVVDDGSRDPAAIAEVAARHGARLLRRPTATGPAAARNAGLAATSAGIVAFLDSDCLPPPGWVAALAGHLADPRVGAAAPRVAALPGTSVLARYAAARCPLDLGTRPALVRPAGRVPYVPTAALVVRRRALPDPPFDPGLRYGEDVDLAWWLHDAGWQVRYDPRTVVRHQEPGRWAAWLYRRHLHATSSAPLAARHPGRLAPAVVAPAPALAWLALLLGHPLAATACAAVPVSRLALRLRRTGLPRRTALAVAVQATGRAVVRTGEGTAGAGAAVFLPLLAALLVARRTRRPAALALLLPPLLEYRRRRPTLDPLRWAGLRLVEDLAYATGVWRSCLRARSTAALRVRRG